MTVERGIIKQKDGARMARATVGWENFAPGQNTATRPVSVNYTIALAKVTNIDNAATGRYSASEVLINAATDTMVILPNGRKWGDINAAGAADTLLEELFELGFSDGISVGDVVVVMATNIAGLGGKPKWAVISTAAGGGLDSTSATRSCEVALGKVQLRNDVPFDSSVTAPTIIPTQVGEVNGGNMAYGGIEDGSDGKQRAYKWMSYHDAVTTGYLMAGTNAFKQTDSDADGIGFLNNMWIRIDHRFFGQVAEIHHGLCAQGFYEQSDGKGKFSVTPAGGTQGVIFGSPTSGAPATIAMGFDTTGHLRILGGSYGEEDDYPEDINIAQVSGDAPSSGTLYNTSITQTATLTDEAGDPTDEFNGGVGTILYTAKSAEGDILDLGFTASTSASVPAAATTIGGAGTGGNNTAMKWDLSKQLNGTDVSLTSFLVNQNRSSTATVSGIDSVKLICAIQSPPVPDNTSFDIRVTLVYGPNATLGNAGDRFTRFDAGGEYRVRVQFIYEDEPAFVLLESTATVASFAGNTLSGADLPFTFDFPTTRAGSTVCAIATLEFFSAAANPQPLPNQIGQCNITNAGNQAKDCQLITGTAAVGTLVFAADTYNPSGTSGVIIGGVDYTLLDNPIVLEYTISKGGNTTDFSDAGASAFPVTLFSGVDEVGWSVDGLHNESTFVIGITNPVSGTDGFTRTITHIETSFISDGQVYYMTVPVDGVTIAEDSFSFNSLSAFLATDYFGDNSADEPFQMFDSFSGIGDDSAAFGDAIMTERFSSLSNSANATINSGGIKVNITSATISMDVIQTFSAYGDFETTITCSNVSMAGTGILRAMQFSSNIGGDRVYVVRAFNENGAVNGYYWETDALGILGFIANQSDSSFELTIKRTNDLVELQIGGVTQSGGSFTKTGEITDVKFNTASNPGSSPTTFTANIDDYSIKLENIAGSLVDYYRPNSDRWTQSHSGTAYQLVNPDNNKLEQIITSSTGTDTVSLLSNFSADKNIVTTNTFLFTAIVNQSSMISGESVYLEVTNATVTVWRIGFKNTGSGMIFFVSIDGGATDAFTASQSNLSATWAVAWDGNDVTFLLDGVVKYTISSWTNTDITDIDIHTTKTATSNPTLGVSSLDIQSPVGTQWSFDVN